MGLFDEQDDKGTSSQVSANKRRAVDSSSQGSDILPIANAAIADLDNRQRTPEGPLTITFEFAGGNEVAEFVLKGNNEYNDIKVKGTQHPSGGINNTIFTKLLEAYAKQAEPGEVFNKLVNSLTGPLDIDSNVSWFQAFRAKKSNKIIIKYLLTSDGRFTQFAGSIKAWLTTAGGTLLPGAGPRSHRFRCLLDSGVMERARSGGA